MSETPKRSRGGLMIVIVIVVAAIVLAIVGIVPRMKAQTVLEQQTKDAATLPVVVVHPKQGSSTQELVLPGTIQAFEDAAIFARTSGYLKRWNSDIGARVKKGQLLAEIESPEIDQQGAQAKADLATATANSELSDITAARYRELRKTDSVSQQDLDNALGDSKAKHAMLNSAEANVHRLEQLQSFERIEVPFDGVVTARNTDVGQLIGAGNSAGKELFHLAAISTLRVFVNVPQIYSRAAQPGVAATLTLAELPGKSFPGKLVRNASTIDLTSRTLLAEVDVDNKGGELLPGAYAQVHLQLEHGVQTLRVPVSTLIFQSDGLKIATVGPDGYAHLTAVLPGRDFGSEIEITSGLTANQLVIDNPPDSLSEHQKVHPVERKDEDSAKVKSPHASKQS
jgi:RND family efflux transporter MFP subunit